MKQIIHEFSNKDNEKITIEFDTENQITNSVSLYVVKYLNDKETDRIKLSIDIDESMYDKTKGVEQLKDLIDFYEVLNLFARHLENERI